MSILFFDEKKYPIRLFFTIGILFIIKHAVVVLRFWSRPPKFSIEIIYYNITIEIALHRFLRYPFSIKVAWSSDSKNIVFPMKKKFPKDEVKKFLNQLKNCDKSLKARELKKKLFKTLFKTLEFIFFSLRPTLKTHRHTNPYFLALRKSFQLNLPTFLKM